MTTVKPPLGVMPEALWRELRVLELARAISDAREFLTKYDHKFSKEERDEYLDRICEYGRQLKEMPAFSPLPL